MLTASIFKDIEYKEDRPSFTILLQNDYLKESRILFKANQIIREHTSPYPIVVEVVEGHIEFGAGGIKHQLEKGDIINLDAKEPHDLKAVKDSIVRLSHLKFLEK